MNNKIDSTAQVSDELRKKRTKKKIIIAIAVLLAVGAVSGGVLLLWDGGTANKGSLGMYGSNQSYIHYAPDYDLDVESVPEYMQLDRQLYLKTGGETTVLEPGGSYSKDVEFFFTYFDCAVHGRYEEYNSLFTDNYYKSNEPYTRFAPQMIYDISLEKLGETESNGKTAYNFNVSYKIFRNNGTFRNDIGSGGSKTLFFSLVEENGKMLIDRITYYVN